MEGSGTFDLKKRSLSPNKRNARVVPKKDHEPTWTFPLMIPTYVNENTPRPKKNPLTAKLIAPVTASFGQGQEHGMMGGEGKTNQVDSLHIVN